ncbi:MAG: ankyrin repeat-containing domain protein [Lentinula lateritia]|uniref:Ankyrin repeat-containing domain protein n=1 Tax=Lentinula lateritia TaxID=40482 RepID=A0ABQ8VDZ1_9AGAR|nr:MAG: ankyrin repeat-containing domain protein [Lentinula lateritia]KAJ4489834.1 ankyrin repeat-containing domain protein [Lentinula lateritia]
MDGSGWSALHIAGRIVKGLPPCKQVRRHYAASKSRLSIGKLLISRGADINAKDKANQTPLHRAATTGSVGFIRLLLDSSTSTTKTRLNTPDRIGNTPLHLAMDSAHAEAAVVLIEAGADRSRLNQDGETAEDMDGVGGGPFNFMNRRSKCKRENSPGVEQRRAKQHVVDSCGNP